MPKGLPFKSFGRRKSSSNVLDFDTEPPSTSSSFRVLERPDKATNGADSAGAQQRAVTRPFHSPLQEHRGQSVNDLGQQTKSAQASKSDHSAWQLKWTRGSSATTHSGSSGNNESVSTSGRYSSSSTLPSSLEQEREHEKEHSDDELFPARNPASSPMFHHAVAQADRPLPPPPSFKSRTARAFSFGRKPEPPPHDTAPTPPPHASSMQSPNMAPVESSRRERATTGSSYASTAVPTKPELSLRSSYFGTDDFTNMFDTLKDDPAPAVPGFHRTDSEPIFPPKAYSRKLTPSPKPPVNRGDSSSPYSWDGRNSQENIRRGSRDGLLNMSSAGSSPIMLDGPMPSVSGHPNGVTQKLLGGTAAGYAPVPAGKYSPAIGRASSDSQAEEAERSQETGYATRQKHLDDGDRWTQIEESRDPQAPSVRSSILKKPVPSSYKPQAPHSSKNEKVIANTSNGGPSSPTRDRSSAAIGSRDATPKAHKSSVTDYEESLFDSSPLGVPSRAMRPDSQIRFESSSTMKKMTSAQFQALQRHSDATKILRNEPDLSGDEYDDDEDGDRALKMASQRRKQEANMAVYRQQMKKVTGGGPTDLPGGASATRPNMDRGSSAPASIGLHFGGMGGTPPPDVIQRTVEDDEDDDVPLGILQAHGFPSSNRPPTRLGENDLPYQKRTSVAGSVVGGGGGQGPLPAFARRLPADPYFGAGLVNHSTRESLALHGSGASVYGGTPSIVTPPSNMNHPGGLVGVIAGEERARAARRGSPSAAMLAQSGSLPLPSNMPQAGRAMSMGNLPPPQMYNPAGAMPPMPMMPMMPPINGPMDAGQQQQLQEFMQMQMQFMQSMMQMQQAQLGHTPPPTQPSPTGDYLGVNFNNSSRPTSMASQISGWGSRPAAPGLQPAGQGRAMTMMAPPSGWNGVSSAASLRPVSVMPGTVGGSAGGPGPGYTPSIAPSERSNVGMPSRYRPVTQSGDDFTNGSVRGARTHSLTSSMTLQGFAPASLSTPNLLSTNGSTIRVVDRPKSSGALKKMAVRTSVGQDEDEEDGWAAMKQKREDRKKGKAGSRQESLSDDLGILYKSLD